MSSEEGFSDYFVKTNSSGVALYVFVLAFTVLSFLSIAPLVMWGRRQEKRRREQEEHDEIYQRALPKMPSHTNQATAAVSSRRRPNESHGEVAQNPLPEDQEPSIFRNADLLASQATQEGPRRRRSRQSSFGNIMRELDRGLATSYPNAEFMSRVSGSFRSRQGGGPDPPPNSPDPSQIPSAATTSRLHATSGTSAQPQTRVWDVGGRKWKRRRPIGRPDAIYQAFYAETQTMGTNIVPPPAEGLGNSANVVPPPAPKFRLGGARPAASLSRGMSDVAGSVLSEDLNEEEDIQEFRAAYSRQRKNSFSSASENSFLRGPVIDDITPNDAADADDPGRINSFEEVEPIEITCCFGHNAIWKPRTMMLGMDGLLEIAEPDIELKRLVGLSIPRTLGAISEGLFRAIMVCVISHYIGTDAMVAYLLVTRLIYFTDELTSAITDAEGSLCSHALSDGNFFLAGQVIQIALVSHLCLNGGILACWAFTMDSVVHWFVALPDVANHAISYTQVIVFYHLIQTVSRNITTIFHLTGNDNFETHFSIAESVATLIILACVVALDSDSTLETVGWIQVMIGLAALVVKLAYAVLRGWLQSFLPGLFSFALRNVAATKVLLMTSLPLFIGTFLEYGEWTLLMVFVHHLGPAEVATWALLGIIFDILEAATEGIGEAAAIRVAYHLGNGNAELGRAASYKAIFLSTIQSLVVTSCLFMFGKNIATRMTSDPTLQHLLNDTLTLLGIGNIVLSYAMICWSLIGAQGRYRLATLCVLVARWLVTTPMAIICVYGFFLDIDSAMGSVVVGYAAATTALAYVLLRSDWALLSSILKEMNAMEDGELANRDDPGTNEQDKGIQPDEEIVGVSELSTDANEGTKPGTIRQRSS